MLQKIVLTRPISEVQDATMVLGTVVDNRTREVMLIGRLGRFGSTPFLVGGRKPCAAKISQKWYVIKSHASQVLMAISVDLTVK